MNSDKALLGLFISGVLIIYTAIVFAFFGSEGETRIIYLFLIGAPFAAAFFMAPRVGLIVLGVLVYSIDWISEDFGIIPREGTWLIDIMLVMYVVRMIITSPWRKARINKIEFCIYLAIAFSIVSAIVNSVGQTTYLIGIRVAFKYILLFIAAYHMDLSREWVRRYTKFLFIVAFAQPAVVTLQYLFTHWEHADDMTGTFGHGQTPGVALFLLVMLTLLVARMIERRKFKASVLWIAIWFTVAAVLGEAKFYFLVLPVLMLLMLRAEFFRRPIIAIGIMIIGAIMMFSVDYVIVQSGYWKEGRNPLTYITRLGEVYEKDVESTTRDDAPRRIFSLLSATRLAAANPQRTIFGEGPGVITNSFVSDPHSQTKHYYALWLLSSDAPTLAWLLIEYGYVGTILMILPMLLIFRRGRILRRSEDEEMRVYGRWLEGLTLLEFLWMIYTSALQIDGMSYVFWMTAAALVRLSYVEEAKQEEDRIAEARARSLADIMEFQPYDPLPGALHRQPQHS